jgi:hypothetical protein
VGNGKFAQDGVVIDYQYPREVCSYTMVSADGRAIHVRPPQKWCRAKQGWTSEQRRFISQALRLVFGIRRGLKHCTIALIKPHIQQI